jgi:WD40 repeat protein
MIAQETEFYVAGGTLEPDAPSYVERQADSDLFTHLSHGEFCYVLTSRQMGKSSLMARTAARLRAEGIAVVLLELTALGQNLTAEQWYDGLLGHIGQELELEEELERFWLDHERLSPLQRWLRALREVVLPAVGVRSQGPGVRGGVARSRFDGPESTPSLTPDPCPLTPGAQRLVICLDEIDAVRSLPFTTDEFFAGIRECYNRRSEDATFHRLTFCLLGVFTPSDLIRDTRTTPFNIGRRIELNDFQEREAAALAQGLGRKQTLGAALLKRVLYWTGGHPYLTQRLCREVAQDPQVRDAAAVDRLCAELFLSHGARERDDNLLFVRERLLRSEADLASLLTLYGQVRRGQRVRDDETNPLVSILRLSGITRVEEPGPRAPSRPPRSLRSLFPFSPSTATLRVRNRIYARVFDGAWVAANMPNAELRRQRAAFRNGLLRSAAVACAVVGVVGALALSAVSERDRARRLLYVADMNVVQQALSEGNTERAEELLDEHRPGRAGGADLRGFEWRYLWRQCQQDALYTFHENAGMVWDVAYSPDGKLLATVNEDSTVRLWDVATRKLVTTLQPNPEHTSRGNYNYEMGDASTGKIVGNSVAFSPDGKTLAATSTMGVYCVGTLWDVATKRELKTLSPSPNGPLAFSPDARLLAVAGWAGNNTSRSVGIVKLWDVTTQQEAATFQWPRRLLWSVAFSPDGRLLATVVGNKGVGVCDVAAKRNVALLPTHPKDWVQAVAFSPDGKKLATCSEDQTVRLWNLPPLLRSSPDGRVPGSLSPPAVHPRSGYPTRSAGTGAPPFWRVVATLKGTGWHARSTSRFKISPDGKKLATVNETSAAVTLWDLDRREKIATLHGHRKSVVSVAFSPDSKTLATASADGTVKLWSATPTREGTDFGKLQSEGLSVAFAPDSKAMATGNADGSVTLWSAETGSLLTTLQGHSGSVPSVAFSPDGRLLASGGSDHTVRLWAVASPRPLATLSGHKDRVWCVAFSPDGKTLASGGEDGAVKLWDTAAGREIATLETGAGVVMSLSFSPDSKALALGTIENSVKVWDVGSRQEVASLPAHTSSVTAIAFSPDGKILASGSRDHTVLLWDVAARQPLGQPLKGCEGRVNSVAFSPDGKTLAGGSSDDRIRLWNVRTGREVGTLKGPRGPVSCVAFAPDGNTLAAVGKERAVRLWRAPSFNLTDAQPVAAKAPGQSGWVKSLPLP